MLATFRARTLAAGLGAWMLLAVAAPAGAAAPRDKAGSAPATRAVGPGRRLFQITLRYIYSTIPKHVQRPEFWFPFPPYDSFQRGGSALMMAPYQMDQKTDPDSGNVIYYMIGGPRGGVPMQVSFRIDMERMEDQRLAAGPQVPPPSPAAEKAIREKWLKGDSRSLISREAKSRASKATSGKKNTLEKARALYEYVVDKVTLLTSLDGAQGAGMGNLDYVLQEMKGDPVDMAAAFIGLCRAAGIPARSIMGLKIPEGVRSGAIHGYHAWAEFYLEGTGWIPVDPAEGSRHPSRRGDFFGRLDPHRIVLSTGRDIVLIPPQKGRPLNYFVNPYSEGDGVEMPTPWVEVQFEELDKIPQMEILPEGADEIPPPETGKPSSG